ncbi:uncharacterized protein LOC101854983 [Aplysia californica]|uniref:Uncharacterized protein LOC101854983 n=1 Tax=Aplysia californica TaxID=6500 RepID=A0ABM1AA45_APLCA|nr:uncharacterized protein LOC101854983 [Aplysia californica]
MRGSKKGPENFYETGVVSSRFNAIHDHSNYASTVGMGEIAVVQNGVEFRTRHNDYKLKMPSTTSTEYHATENVPFPDVPPEVTSLSTVDEQIVEMREWFKAFATQNTTHRDYREYFKPIMCYLEGAWTLDADLTEPFESDRHHIDANSWFELHDIVRYASYTGTKSRLENFAYLPTTIMSVNETTGEPTYAQWNYRILCSPLKEDMPLKHLRQMDDLAYRVPNKKTQETVRYSRAARYRVYEGDKDRFTKYSKIDRLFYTVPGMDNIPSANMSQESFGEEMFSMESDKDIPLKIGYYHRWFRFGQPGAMGQKTVARGYNDANLWVAQTTQERVAPIRLHTCTSKRVKVNNKWKKQEECKTVYTRFSYAIPLEIIFLTPLQSWNPYDIETFKGDLDTSDPADTVKKSVGVLDRGGNLRKTTASGVKIVLQDIEGVGRVRLRYPIAPLHGEGSPVWKELNALKYMVKEQAAKNAAPPAEVSFMIPLHRL